MKTDFLPHRDGDLDSFEGNFSGKLDMYAAILDISPDELAATKGLIEEHRQAFSKMISKKADAMSATEENRLKRGIAVNELRRIAKKIKTSKQYTDAIGDALRIIGPNAAASVPDNMKPILSARFNGQDIVIRFKKSRTDGIRLFARTDEAEFREIAVVTANRYIDIRPKANPSKPEMREYYGVYVSDYVDIGHRSDIVKVVVP